MEIFQTLVFGEYLNLSSANNISPYEDLDNLKQ